MAHQCVKEDDIKELREKADKSVSWVVFWSVIVLLVGINGSIISKQYSEIQTLSEENKQTQILSARIETQLTQIQTDILDIKISLKEHQSGTVKR